jgi:hypothetical protein
MILKYPKAIWIHFYKNCMNFMDMDNTVKAIETPKMPYHHPRMVLADFESATTTLKASNYILKQCHCETLLC